MRCFLPYLGFILGGLGLLTFVGSLVFDFLCCYSLIFFIAAVVVFSICFVRGCCQVASHKGVK